MGGRGFLDSVLEGEIKDCAKIGKKWPKIVNQAFEKGVESPKMFMSNVGAKCCKQHAGS